MCLHVSQIGLNRMHRLRQFHKVIPVYKVVKQSRNGRRFSSPIRCTPWKRHGMNRAAKPLSPPFTVLDAAHGQRLGEGVLHFHSKLSNVRWVWGGLKDVYTGTRRKQRIVLKCWVRTSDIRGMDSEGDELAAIRCFSTKRLALRFKDKKEKKV